MFFSVGFHGIKGAVKRHSSWLISWIYEAFIPLNVTATFNILNYTPLYSKTQIESIIWSLPSWDHIRCLWTDIRRSQRIRLQQVGCLAHNNAQMTMCEHQMIMLELNWAKTLNSGNPRITFIHHHHPGIATCLRSHHFQTLPSSTTRPHSTWHQAHNQALVQPKDIRVVGHHGKHMISSKEDMVDLKRSPLSSSQDWRCHLQAHNDCLQNRLEAIQSFGRHLPLEMHQDKFPAYLGDHPLGSQRNDFSRLRTRAGQMLQRLLICPHCQIFPMKNMMQNMRATIGQALTVPKAKPQSACRQRNSPWSNLPQGWGSPTLLHSTSGRKYGWLGVSRRSMGPLSWERTVWHSVERDPCMGRRRLLIFWRLSSPGCLWTMLIMPNGFSDSGLRCFWRNVQARFGRRGIREGEATSERRRMWQSAQATNWQVTSLSCQIQLSWLWFIECWMATMTRHPATNSKLHTQMWCTGRSWLISSNKIVARKNHIVWMWYPIATWHRKNWTKSIWDVMHTGKWWMAVYKVRFDTTVPFRMPSSWNWDTVWNYFW